MNIKLADSIMIKPELADIMIAALSMGGDLDNDFAYYEYEDMMMRAIYTARVTR